MAELLDPAWGVDVIIGGHTHTILEKPEEVAGILIVQAGVGTQQIGRFDIIVDTNSNSVHEYKWELIPIDSGHCPRNEQMEDIIKHFKDEVDRKYNRPLCNFVRPLFHKSRYEETEIGNLLADVLSESLNVDILMLGSGSIRKQEIRPTLTYGGLMELFPYDDKMLRLKATGSQFKRMYRYMLRDEMLEGGHTEFYQYSEGLKVVFDRKNKEFLQFDYCGAPIEDEKLYTIAIQDFHYQNFENCFGFQVAELEANDKPKILTTSILDILVEHLPSCGLKEKNVEGRLVLQG